MTAIVPTKVLSDVDLAMLRFADQWWHNGGAQESAIVERFGVPAVRFHQRLAYLITLPAALAAEPTVVRRLQRVVAARRVGRHHTTGGRP